MKIGFHSTALDGQTVTLTANGIGPVTQANWGQPAGGGSGGSGTAGIVVDRTTLKVAPDAVRFRVDLTGAGFDTAAGAANRYNPQAHDLIYLWDLGDAADFVAPEKILPEWRAKRHAKGPFVAHCYATPGTYDVSVLVIEPSSGKTATYSTQVVVGNADTAYPGNQTICINPVGDSDFSGAPTGAVQINSATFTGDLAEWQAANTQNRGPCRYLLKRGGTYAVSLQLSSTTEPSLMFGAYGTGARPIVNNTGAVFNIANGYRGTNADDVTDFRLWGWDIRGNFDPTTDPHTDKTGKAQYGIWSLKYLDALVHDCAFSGFYFSTIIHQPNRRDIRQHFMISDCSMTNVGGQYPVFYGKVDHGAASISHIGCRIAQNPDALSHGNGVYRALTRIERCAWVHFRSCDYFHVERFQPCVKFSETPQIDATTHLEGAVISVHSCSFEGGLRPVGLALNSDVGVTQGARATVQNMILDGCVVVGDYSTSQMVDLKASGVTIRNGLFIQPNALYLGVDCKRLFGLKIDHGTTVPAYVGAAPVKFYSNTVVNQRVPAKNAGYSIALGNAVFLSHAAIENNVVEGIAAPPSGCVNGFAPYDGAVLWAPRSKGYKNPTTGVLNTAHATPVDAVKRYKPQAGSAAIGAAATGRRSVRDLARATRATPGVAGAWEAA